MVREQDRLLSIELLQKNVAEPMVTPATPVYYFIFAEYLWRAYEKA